MTPSVLASPVPVACARLLITGGLLRSAGRGVVSASCPVLEPARTIACDVGQHHPVRHLCTEA